MVYKFNEIFNKYVDLIDDYYLSLEDKSRSVPPFSGGIRGEGWMDICYKHGHGHVVFDDFNVDDNSIDISLKSRSKDNGRTDKNVLNLIDAVLKELKQVPVEERLRKED